MAKIEIKIESEKITATPSGYDKSIKNQFSSFGGAQRPWAWNGEQWVIEGESKVEYWAEKVKGMFASWKTNPCVVSDVR